MSPKPKNWINWKDSNISHEASFKTTKSNVFENHSLSFYNILDLRLLKMADAAIRLFTTKLSIISGLATSTASPDQRPGLSRRSSSISSISSISSASSINSLSSISAVQAEETELQPWNYSRTTSTAQDEVERKKSELRSRRAREAEGIWREFWG